MRNRRLMFTVNPVDADAQGGAGAADPDKGEQTFTQADVDRIVADRLKREREAVKAKYADYDDLKSKAAGAQTAEQRIASLEQEIKTTQREALRRRVQAAHGISDDDADLFLTAADEESLIKQAQRLAERDADRKKVGNRAPLQGRITSSTSAGADEVREFTRQLFGRI